MDLLHSSKNEERKSQMKFVYILQDFNMVKIKSRPQTKLSKQEIKTYKQRLHWIEI